MKVFLFRRWLRYDVFDIVIFYLIKKIRILVKEFGENEIENVCDVILEGTEDWGNYVCEM